MRAFRGKKKFSHQNKEKIYWFTYELFVSFSARKWPAGWVIVRLSLALNQTSRLTVI